jgi:hypothetical protein
MKTSGILVPQRTPVSAGVRKTPAESSNVGRSVPSIQTTIRKTKCQVDIAMMPLCGR